MMKYYSTAIISLSLFTFIFQGCNNQNDVTAVYPSNINSAASVTTDDKSAIMAPSVYALEEVAENIDTMLKRDINKLNQQEAIIFDSEISYCDISGEQERSTRGNFQTFISNVIYQACKEDGSIQDGEIELTYTQTDDEGKYPENIKLLVQRPYTLNEMVLHKNFYLEASIIYKEKNTIEKISLTLNGLVNFNYQTLEFKAFKHTLSY